MLKRPDFNAFFYYFRSSDISCSWRNRMWTATPNFAQLVGPYHNLRKDCYKVWLSHNNLVLQIALSRHKGTCTSLRSHPSLRKIFTRVGLQQIIPKTYSIFSQLLLRHIGPQCLPMFRNLNPAQSLNHSSAHTSQFRFSPARSAAPPFAWILQKKSHTQSSLL